MRPLTAFFEEVQSEALIVRGCFLGRFEAKPTVEIFD